jgi:hypothetical protein
MQKEYLKKIKCAKKSTQTLNRKEKKGAKKIPEN